MLKCMPNPSVVERRVEKLDSMKQARHLVAGMPKGIRKHRYIDRLAHDVRRNRLDPDIFARFMEIIDHVRY